MAVAARTSRVTSIIRARRTRKPLSRRVAYGFGPARRSGPAKKLFTIMARNISTGSSRTLAVSAPSARPECIAGKKPKLRSLNGAHDDDFRARLAHEPLDEPFNLSADFLLGEIVFNFIARLIQRLHDPAAAAL